MAKQRLVESFCGPKSKYKEVTEAPKYAPLVESFKKNKKKLTESTMQGVQKVLQESKLDETLAGKVLTNLKEQGLNTNIRLWQFPISKINTKENPNYNNRAYTKPLWEHVLNDQADIWKGGTGLANHPADDEDGDFMKQSIVWLDGFLDEQEGLVYGVGTFVGDGGALAQQIIDCGGRIGFSTSGYGDFLADGVVVDPESYEIDRFADLVLNPSQGVYGNAQDSVNVSEIIQEQTGNKNMKKTDLQESKKKSLKEGEEASTDTENVETTESEDTEVENQEEGTEEAEGEEGESLSEQLLVSHYKEAIKTISKKSNKLWEEKIHDLEQLVNKLKKESLNKKSKTVLNETIQHTISSIMEDTSKAIQEGYEARELCEELHIKDLSKLHGIHEKIEDFTALEECLAKTTKESNKYKTLYEEKVQSLSYEAKEAFDAEKSLKESQEKVDALKDALKERKNEGIGLKSQLAKSKIATIKALKEVKDLKQNLTETEQALINYKAKVAKLQESLTSTKQQLNEKVHEKQVLVSKIEKLNNSKMRLEDLLNESEKTIHVLSRKNESIKKVAEDRKYRLEENIKAKKMAERADRMHIHGIDGSVVKGENLFREADEIGAFLDKIDAPEETKSALMESKTLREAQDRYLFTNELLNEEEELKRSKINNNRGPSPTSLAEMFR